MLCVSTDLQTSTHAAVTAKQPGNNFGPQSSLPRGSIRRTCFVHAKSTAKESHKDAI